MKAITTLEIIIILVVLVVTALFVLSWLGLGTNPLDWFKKQTIKNTFCGEIQERTNCQLTTVNSVDDLGINSDDTSTKIKYKDIMSKNIGAGMDPDKPAQYGDICKYLGQDNFKECLKRFCGCKFTS